MYFGQSSETEQEPPHSGAPVMVRLFHAEEPIVRLGRRRVLQLPLRYEASRY